MRGHDLSPNLQGIDMRLIILSVALAAFGLTASANIYDECKKAIKNADLETAKEISAKILSFNSVSISDHADGAACLSYAMGKDYVFSFVLNTFSPKEDEDAIIEVKKREASERAIEQEKRQAEADERRRLRREAELATDAAKRANVSAVWKRVFVACNELFADDPNTAVTNQICLNVFLETGLPNE